jgi:glycerophosphoryl diester phosphodiesterase
MVDHAVVYQSPNYLKRLKALNPRVRALPPLNDPKQLDRLADDVQPYGVDARWSILSKELIDRCHARGIRVFSDALGLHETISDYTRAMEWGIDVIQTDHPARVWRAVELFQERRQAVR